MVLVAVPHKLLDDTHAEFTAAFKSAGVQFRKLAVDLSRPGYVETIAAEVRPVFLMKRQSAVSQSAAFLLVLHSHV